MTVIAYKAMTVDLHFLLNQDTPQTPQNWLID